MILLHHFHNKKYTFSKLVTTFFSNFFMDFMALIIKLKTKYCKSVKYYLNYLLLKYISLLDEGAFVSLLLVTHMGNSTNIF